MAPEVVVPEIVNEPVAEHHNGNGNGNGNGYSNGTAVEVVADDYPLATPIEILDAPTPVAPPVVELPADTRGAREDRQGQRQTALGRRRARQAGRAEAEAPLGHRRKVGRGSSSIGSWIPVGPTAPRRSGMGSGIGTPGVGVVVGRLGTVRLSGSVVVVVVAVRADVVDGAVVGRELGVTFGMAGVGTGVGCGVPGSRMPRCVPNSALTRCIGPGARRRSRGLRR